MPVEPLKKWMSTKGIPEEASFAINRNIFKFGIAPTYFFGTSIDALVEMLATDFEDDLDFYVDTFISNMFEKGIKRAD